MRFIWNRYDFSKGKRFISEEKFGEMRQYTAQTGDLLVSMMGTAGKCQIFPQDAEVGIIDSHLLRIRVNEEKVLPSFLRLLIDEAETTVYQVKLLGKGSIMQGLNSSIIKDLLIPLPSLTEQHAVMSFLEHETTKIDTLISKQERLIELLQEKRQAVISRAVTKGLEPNAPTKDSGVAWLGKVPEHWTVLKFSYRTSIRNGQVDPKAHPYKDYLLVAPNHIESSTGRLISTETAEEQGADSGKYLCRKGEIIYSKIRPVLAKACLSPDDQVICSADMYPIAPNSTLNNKFLLYLLISEPFTKYAVLESDRVAMPKLNRETLGAFRIPVPPYEEQQRIVKSVEEKILVIDKLIAKALEAITIMQERRTALISAAVTGKIDVRDWTPETDEDAA